jgi:predicted methyltransferase
MRHLSLLLLALASCATAPARPAATAATAPTAAAVSVPDALRAVVDAPDRSADDRALDAGRHPAETLAFFGVRPGWRVAELFAGGGYTAELLARAVGPGGRVYGQNNRFLLERFAEAPWAARLATAPMRNVTRVDRELDAPIPPEATNLDAVFFLFSYHDTVWLHTDRAAMNRAVFDALRPGGVYAIIDHSAAAGHGLDDVQTLHRIEQSALVAEVLAAGFRLDAEAAFLRNPSDARDWSASPRTAGERRGTSDRFVLRFVKP